MDRETETPITLPDGRIYYGDAKDGVPDGKGRMYIESRDTYEGEFKNGAFHGKGKYYLAGRLSYHGEWRRGEKHGKGEEWLEGGGSYVGDFRHGLKHGKGSTTYCFSEVFGSHRYEGGFSYGVYGGRGRIFFDMDFSLTGRFESGMPTGKARFLVGEYIVLGARDRDAVTVVGADAEYKNGGCTRFALRYSDGRSEGHLLPDGAYFGVVAKRDGEAYLGGLAKGRVKHGFGVTFYKGGVTVLCGFSYGVAEGRAIGYFPDGIRAEWSYTEGLPTQVVAYMPDGGSSAAELDGTCLTLKK